MVHKRQTIREAVVSRLNAMPDWAGRVFANRSRPTEATELPVALVYTVSEESELANMAGGLSRTLTINIELRVAAVLALDDALDAFAEAAETAMSTDQTFAGLVFLSYLRGTTVGIDGEGEARQAIATLNYEFRYETDATGA